MILQRLLIENFRQFYGSQYLEFANGSDSRNVTLIHGFNGAGKTTLLNAFVWCLFGKTTEDFGAPDHLLNEKASREAAIGAQIRVVVSLQYQWQNKDYYLERSQVCTRLGTNDFSPGRCELKLSQIVGGHMSVVDGSPDLWQEKVSQMLPVGLYQFFFFNGERVEWLARAEASKEVEKGVRTLLDVEVYDRALYHLRGDVSKELNAELKSVGNAELKEALEQEEQETSKRAILEQTQGELQSNIAACQDQIEAYERRQGEIRALAEISARRAALRRELEETKRSMLETNGELARVLSDDGYLAFGAAVIDGVTNEVKAARERGELPAKIKPQFVDDLLERQSCICGQSLQPGRNDEQIHRLEEWRRQVGLAALDESVSHLSASMPGLQKRRADFFETSSRLVGKRDEIYRNVNTLQDEIALIESQMGNQDHGEEAVALQRALDSERAKLIKLMAQETYLCDQISVVDETIRGIKHRIEKLRAQGDRERLVRRQKEAVEHITQALAEIGEVLKQDVRSDLSAGIAEIWDDAAIKPYRASLREDFTLSLTRTIQGIEEPVRGASTGEKQVLATSFIGSLVRKARDNLRATGQSSHSLALPVGGQYPLVMDSPFGSLEDEYRSKVAQWLPRLAHQVVILVSNTQWRDEVERETRASVGKEYILELHTPKHGAARPIRILGQEYGYVVEELDAEYTAIREVS